MASRVAEHTGNEADDSFSDDQHRYFPTDEHIVSDGDLFDAVVAGGIVDDALVNTLIAPTSEHNVVLRRPGPRHVLSKGLTGGRRHNEQRFLIDALLITATVHVSVTRLNEVRLRRFQQGCIGNTNGNVVECRSPDLGFHDHARSPRRRACHQRIYARLSPSPEGCVRRPEEYFSQSPCLTVHAEMDRGTQEKW